MLIDVDKFLEALENEGVDVCEDCYDYDIFGFSHETISAAINRVNQEMSARELLLTEGRMKQEDADAYREYASLAWNGKVDEVVAFAEQWVQEHPKGGRR